MSAFDLLSAIALGFGIVSWRYIGKWERSRDRFDMSVAVGTLIITLTLVVAAGLCVL